MKPSAIKNELNAVLHFLKFVKRSRNLAVTDPMLNATLENVKDVVSTFQIYCTVFCFFDVAVCKQNSKR